MTAAAMRPERIRIAPEIEISRALTGLWQVADIEKDGAVIDPEEGAGHLQAYVRAGSIRSTWPIITAAPRSLPGAC